jgi:hypothetical protein
MTIQTNGTTENKMFLLISDSISVILSDQVCKKIKEPTYKVFGLHSSASAMKVKDAFLSFNVNFPIAYISYNIKCQKIKININIIKGLFIVFPVSNRWKISV